MNALQQAERELARGATVNEVALRFGLRRDQVQGVADAMKVRKNGTTAAPAAPPPRPALTGPTPTKPPVKPAPPGDVIDASLARVAASLDELREAPAVADVEQLLTGARDQVEQARERLGQGRERARLDAEIEQLQAQLADRQTQRKQLGGSHDKVPARVVREWAAANSVDCPAHGRVPGHVVDAWRKAGGGAS